ncbi:MAG TPA: hypothetical protein VFP53_03670 [Sphingomicrobium sp.]|nr:hypothetical protein [Sphingomicrobium sp.]
MLLAAEVVRLTIAGSFAESRTDRAARLAPQRPDVLVATAMAGVGQAAAAGQLPPHSVMATLGRLAQWAPLEPEPLLVDAAIAEKKGDIARAEKLLLEARRRDPRSTPARYLLADLWLRQDRLGEGLGEMAILTRLLPATSVQLVPALAALAKSPGASDRLRAILVSNPRVKQPLLNALAVDPDNLDLILDLNSSTPTVRGAGSSWQPRLLNGLIGDGNYARAYQLWRKLSGFPPGTPPTLFNGDFRQVPAPAPFNWTFNSTGAGFAEPGGGRLRVIFYGRNNASLASQLLLLPPGRYRFSSGADGEMTAGAIAWTLSCANSKTKLMDRTLGDATGVMTSTFVVPAAGCPAQQLALVGRAQDTARESDVQIGPVAVERVGD